MKEAHVVVRLEQRMLKRLREMAKAQDLSVSWLIRKAIDRFLKEGEHADKP